MVLAGIRSGGTGWELERWSHGLKFLQVKGRDVLDGRIFEAALEMFLVPDLVASIGLLIDLRPFKKKVGGLPECE
jgi:hypothetical protein